MKPQRIAALLILCLSLLNTKGQNKIDSLDALLAKHHGNIDSALFYAKLAREEALAHSMQKELVRYTNETGTLFARKGEFDSAVKYFEQNLATGKRPNNDDYIARGNINIANIYLTQGKYNSAVDRYLSALKFVEKGNDKTLQYINNLCLGITYYYLKQYAQSLSFYERCLKICEEQKNEANKAYCYNAMGIIKKETHNYHDALGYFLKTNSIAEQVHDSIILSHNLGNMGELYGLLGKYDEAEKALLKGIALTRKFDDYKGLGENLVLLGNVLVKRRDYSKAVDQYKEALAIGEKIGIGEIRKDSYLGLSDAYEGMRNFEKANEYHRMFSRMKDSLFNVTSSSQIADMQTRYETEKKENENVLLAKDNNIKSLEISRQKDQRNWLIAGFALILILVALLYNSRRLKHRNKILQEKELRNLAVFQAQEKERVHLSKELHDGLGPLLSLIKMNITSLKPAPENEKTVSEIKELATQSIREVRSISHALMPSLLHKQGLEAALADFVEQVNTSGALRIELEYDIASGLTSETQLNIYRVIQEALNNTMRHANASEATIALTEKSGLLHLTISDNGKGMDLEKTSLGNGLNNIYSRVDFLKGKISIDSSPGKGLRYDIDITLKQIQHA